MRSFCTAHLVSPSEAKNMDGNCTADAIQSPTAAALENDLLRIQSDVSSDAEQQNTIMVHLHTAQGVVDAEVDKHSQVMNAVWHALSTPTTHRVQRIPATARLQISLGGESIAEGSFDEYGVQAGATIDVVVDEVSFEQVVNDMMALNPHIRRSSLTSHARFDEDGTLLMWPLFGCSLRELPESFGCLTVRNNLSLNQNHLQSLPESFGHLVVGDSLNLEGNQIASLPESFSSIRVGRNLWLGSNCLQSLPDNFGGTNVGGDLSLSRNDLSSLPDSFAELAVGGKVVLTGNDLPRQGTPGLRIEW